MQSLIRQLRVYFLTLLVIFVSAKASAEAPAAEYPKYFACHAALDNVFSYFYTTNDRSTWAETKDRSPRGVEKKGTVLVTAKRENKLGVYIYGPVHVSFCVLPPYPDFIMQKPYIGAGKSGLDMYKVKGIRDEFIIEAQRGEKLIWDPKEGWVTYKGAESTRTRYFWQSEYQQLTCSITADTQSAEAINEHMKFRLSRLNELLQNQKLKEKMRFYQNAVVAELQYAEEKCAPLSRIYSQMKEIAHRKDEWEGRKPATQPDDEKSKEGALVSQLDGIN